MNIKAHRFKRENSTKCIVLNSQKTHFVSGIYSGLKFEQTSNVSQHIVDLKNILNLSIIFGKINSERK